MIYTTCTSEDEAMHITKILLDKNLIACGNIIPKILSIFKWDSKISSESECALFLKTIEETDLTCFEFHPDGILAISGHQNGELKL